jgi:hypothetical protein
VAVTRKKGGRKKLIAVAEVVTLYDSKGRASDWADAVMQAVSEQMFKDYDFETQRAPAKLNRHGVLHGRIPDYGSEANSLKAILLLDVMVHIAIANGVS